MTGLVVSQVDQRLDQRSGSQFDGFEVRHQLPSPKLDELCKHLLQPFASTHPILPQDLLLVGEDLSLKQWPDDQGV